MFLLFLSSSPGCALGDSISSVTGPSFWMWTCIIAPKTPSNRKMWSHKLTKTWKAHRVPFILSGRYCVPSCFSSKLYSSVACVPCIAKWKSGLLPFSRLYKVNWLTHKMSNSRSRTLRCHRFPTSSSKRRRLNSFRALGELISMFLLSKLWWLQHTCNQRLSWCHHAIIQWERTGHGLWCWLIHHQL